jgi:hypothetical protein
MAIEPDSWITGKRDPGGNFSQGGQAIVEIADILAAGFLRVLERKSSQILQGKANSPLDCGSLSGGDVGATNQDFAP